MHYTSCQRLQCHLLDFTACSHVIGSGTPRNHSRLVNKFQSMDLIGYLCAGVYNQQLETQPGIYSYIYQVQVCWISVLFIPVLIGCESVGGNYSCGSIEGGFCVKVGRACIAPIAAHDLPLWKLMLWRFYIYCIFLLVYRD